MILYVSSHLIYYLFANWSLLATLERGLSLRVSGDTPTSPEVSFILFKHLCLTPRIIELTKLTDALSRAPTLVRQKVVILAHWDIQQSHDSGCPPLPWGFLAERLVSFLLEVLV